MDEMSQRIESALPIVKGYLKRHPVPAKEYDNVFQTLRISLWKSIKKQATTHQCWELTYIFEYQARSDLKQEYYLQPLISVPHKRIFDKEWKQKNMPEVLHTQDFHYKTDASLEWHVVPSGCDTFQNAVKIENWDRLSNKFQNIIAQKVYGRTDRSIAKSLGFKKARDVRDKINEIRVLFDIAPLAEVDNRPGHDKPSVSRFIREKFGWNKTKKYNEMCKARQKLGIEMQGKRYTDDQARLMIRYFDKRAIA